MGEGGDDQHESHRSSMEHHSKVGDNGQANQFNYIQLDLLVSVHTDPFLSFTAFPHQRRSPEHRGLALSWNEQQ